MRPAAVIGVAALVVLGILVAAGIWVFVIRDPADIDPIVGLSDVEVVDYDFVAPAIAVSSGTEVTWTFRGNEPHDVVGDGFASALLKTGTFTHRFDEPGEYRYACSVHPSMKGRVVVLDT